MGKRNRSQAEGDKSTEASKLSPHCPERGLYSPDGKCLASGSKDHTVKVWDAQTGEELLSLPVSAPARSVAFSPDGHRLAAGTVGGTVTIWDATPLPAKP
jgi:WD40 repeat protein